MNIQNQISQQVNFVLVGTSHPGNIGAAARAMKAMDVHRLSLVNPKTYPSADATARAAGADDVLAAAKVCSDLDTAIGDANIILGASARLRSNRWPVMDARQAAIMIAAEVGNGSNIAILFGNERSGLSNDELAYCHKLVHIPVNNDFSSLNLASAVQIMAYELKMLATENLELLPVGDVRDVPSTSADMQSFHQHLHESMVQSGYLNEENPGQVMPRMKRLFMRSSPSRNDLKILHGFLKSVKK